MRDGDCDCSAARTSGSSAPRPAAEGVKRVAVVGGTEATGPVGVAVVLEMPELPLERRMAASVGEPARRMLRTFCCRELMSADERPRLRPLTECQERGLSVAESVVGADVVGGVVGPVTVTEKDLLRSGSGEVVMTISQPGSLKAKLCSAVTAASWFWASSAAAAMAAAELITCCEGSTQSRSENRRPSFSLTGGHGSLALRQVAMRARLAWLDAQLDETDEMDDARDERDDLSETMDSGDEPDDDTDGATDGRRLENWKASGTLQAGSCVQGSSAERLMETVCACDIARHMDGRRDAKGAALAAGVLNAPVCGVICGVGSGPMRARDGVGGSMVGLGSKNLGGLVGVGVASRDCGQHATDGVDRGVAGT